MQIQRKPSRWPYVGVLVGLLIACLLAPRYWQTRNSLQHSRDLPKHDSVNRPIRVQVSTGYSSRFADPVIRAAPLVPRAAELDSMALSGLVPNAGPWPIQAGRVGFDMSASPTIDDLISTLSADARTAWIGEAPASAVPLSTYRAPPVFFPVANIAPEPPSATPALPGPRVTAALRWVGEVVAGYSPIQAARWLGESLKNGWERIANQSVILQPGPEIGPIVPDFPAAARPSESQSEATASEPALDTVPLEPVASSAWSVPDALMVQLTRLAQHPYSAHWAGETISQLEALMQLGPWQGEETDSILSALSQLAEAASQLAENAGDDRMRVELLRAHWSLARRIDCWSGMHKIRVASLGTARFASRGSLNAMLAEVPVRRDLESLNAGLEAYERTRDPAIARHVVQTEQALRSSSEPLDVALADAVEQHYRNANIRVAITAEMLNRYVPDNYNRTQPVRDRIAGTPVRGESRTSSASLLRLAPASGRWQMELQSDGVVDSNTTANGGRARVRSYGSTDFTVKKSIVVNPDGVRMERAEVCANNYSHLAGVTTDFDWVPLLGAFARSRAADQYRAKRPQAKAEVEWKVGTQASERLDQEANDTVARVERDFRERVTGPLGEFGVALTPLEMTTTQERLVARLRLAGDSQLAGHTPRPRAPSDSLVSVQLHETALTNAAVGLGLNGRRMTAPELQATLRQKLPRLASDSPPEEREDTTFWFADHGAVQFRMDGGRFEIAILVVEFEREARRIRNFIVHAYYVPVVNGLSAELVREGALGIEGRLTAADRARLYSVFNEVLGAERHLPVVQLNDPSDARLEGLMITQLVLEDGWMGLAIGPDVSGRTAERSRSLR